MQRIDTEKQTNIGKQLFPPTLKKNGKREGVKLIQGNHIKTIVSSQNYFRENIKQNKESLIGVCKNQKSRHRKLGGFKDNDKLEMFSRCFGSTHSRTKMAKKTITPRIKFKTKLPNQYLSYPIVSSFVIFVLAHLTSILMYPVVNWLKLDRLFSISVLNLSELLEIRIFPIYRRFEAIFIRSFLSSSNILCESSLVRIFSNLVGNVLEVLKKSSLLDFGKLSTLWRLSMIEHSILISKYTNTQQFIRIIGLKIIINFSQLLLTFNQRCIQTTQPETKSMINCTKDLISTNQSPEQSVKNNKKFLPSDLKVSLFKFCASSMVFLFCASSKCLNLATSLSKIVSIGVSRKCFVSRGFGVSRVVLLLGLCCCVQAGPDTVNLTDDEENVLHIGGIFPIAGEGGWQGGQACMPAAYLALEDVNKRADLLPGFQLRLHSNDSECEPGLGASVMYNLLYNPPQKLLLLAGCSTVCTTVAEAAKMWNLMVLCYGASSPALSDRRRFPTLFRTHPSATVHNPTRIRLMQRFGWSRVAILQQAEEVFISTVEDLEARCKEAGIEIVTRQSFLSDPGDAVRNLRRQDARIIVGLFYVVAARRVLCDLYKHQLYGSSYVWFFIGWYEDNWFEVNLEREGVECTAEQMRKAAEGHLTTEALMWNQNQHQPTISGMTSEDFRLRLNAQLRFEGHDIDNLRYPEGYQEAPLAYDAVWSVALAFNKTMEKLSKTGRSLKNFTYTDKNIADNIYSAINSTSFLGVSGIVAFSSQGDRIALTQIEQMIGGQYVKLGYYDTQADNLTWLNREKWAGGKVPQDRTIVRRELRLVSLPLFACVTAVAAAGTCVAIGLIVFNVWNSHRRVIQSSHPVCNTIMLVGCALSLAGLVALGADGRFVSPEGFPAVCQARVWLLSLGFTLAYGAMFSKVWRVHRFTTKAKVDPKKKVEPWKLYTMVSGLLLVDAMILLSWQLRDPLRRRVEQFPLEDPPSALDDSKIRPELEHCESEHNTIWLGVMYGYKGLVLVFGLFLAYETRSVKLRQINDSRYVGMSIYNVVVLCLITAPVSLVVASQQDASFAFVSLAVVFCCFLSMALIFVPKVIEVIRHPKDRAESKYNPDAGQSREDEERYHKLLAENDQLQQLITSKEEKIRTLKQKIAEKEVGRTQPATTTILPTQQPITQGNMTLSVAITADPHTLTSDYATMTSDYATMTSEFASELDSTFGVARTRSSRCSQSDAELSESYL